MKIFLQKFSIFFFLNYKRLQMSILKTNKKKAFKLLNVDYRCQFVFLITTAELEITCHMYMYK